MPLQGVWTADDGALPPWKGDYHNDLNTQLSYTHFYKANHLEEGACFVDFLWNSMDAARAFAKKFYGTEGICLPGVMSIDGKALGGWPMYSLSPTQQIWLCQSFEEYYRYTGDLEFLKKRPGYILKKPQSVSQHFWRKERENFIFPYPVRRKFTMMRRSPG